MKRTNYTYTKYLCDVDRFEIADKVKINDFSFGFVVIESNKETVKICDGNQVIESSVEYARANWVKESEFKTGEKIRLDEEFHSRYFTCYEELEVVFMDLGQQDCIVKSLRGIMELVPIAALRPF